MGNNEADKLQSWMCLSKMLIYYGAVSTTIYK